MTLDAVLTRVDADLDAAMERQKAAARAAWKGSGDAASNQVWFDIAEREGSTEFTGYSSTSGEGTIVAIVKDGAEVRAASAGDAVIVLTNQTPFYGESGGQAGDVGTISTPDGLAISVTDTAKPLGRLHTHEGTIEAGTITVGDTVHLDVDAGRRDRIRANHSATHLVHAALRNRLGEHVTQKGSLVAEDRLRFDFSQPVALSDEDIAAIEAEVNAEIRANDPVVTRLMSPDDAIEAGAMALFGEKYGDEVRVVSMGRQAGSGKGAQGDTYSLELCGGTHVRQTGDIGAFVTLGDSASSAGIRRIEALTGQAALDYLRAQDHRLAAVANDLKAQAADVPARVKALLDERKALSNEVAQLRRELAMSGGSGQGGGAEPEMVNGIKFVAQVLSGVSGKDLPALIDEHKARIESGAVLLIADAGGKAAVAAGVTKDCIDKVSAEDLVKAAVVELGGRGGGGRADMAQGGGKDVSNADGAISAAKKVMEG